MDKLRVECIGKQVYIKALNKQVEVKDSNRATLLAHGFTEFFITKDELTPIKKKADKSVESKEPLSIELMKVEALKGFEGKSAKEVKKELDKLEIEYPASATKKALIEIILNL